MYVSQSLHTQQKDAFKRSLLIYNTHLSFSIHVTCLSVLFASRIELSTCSCSIYEVPRSLTLSNRTKRSSLASGQTAKLSTVKHIKQLMCVHIFHYVSTQVPQTFNATTSQKRDWKLCANISHTVQYIRIETGVGHGVNAVIKLRVPSNADNFLTSSKQTLLHTAHIRCSVVLSSQIIPIQIRNSMIYGGQKIVLPSLCRYRS